MEKGKQVGKSSSSSSFTEDLFGPKDSSKSSSSSPSLFGSIFGPPNTVPGTGTGTGTGTGRHTPRSDSGSSYGNTKHEPTDQMSQKSNRATKKDKNSSTYGNVSTTEPCYYNSSIYYGGQEVYSPTTQNISPHHVFKKDGEGVDANENNSNCASRGNWWQGSLYY